MTESIKYLVSIYNLNGTIFNGYIDYPLQFKEKIIESSNSTFDYKDKVVYFTLLFRENINKLSKDYDLNEMIIQSFEQRNIKLSGNTIVQFFECNYLKDFNNIYYGDIEPYLLIIKSEKEMTYEIEYSIVAKFTTDNTKYIMDAVHYCTCIVENNIIKHVK